MNRAPLAVLFDLDGTLLDTAPDLVGALNAVRVSEGLVEAPVQDYREFVSQGALGLLRAGMPAASEAQTAVWKQQFLDHYENHLLESSEPFEGVNAVLETLQSGAIPWGIVTNKPEYLTFPITRALGWHHRAACTICGDTLSRAKPHPDPILTACQLIRVLPQQVVMVGDDVRDIQAAQAAGVTPALVGYGYGSQEAMKQMEREVICLEHIKDLLELFSSVRGAQPEPWQ